MFKEKYIELLLKRCLRVNKNTPLFINYNKVNKDFVESIVEYANNIGINDIYLKEVDLNYEHDLLNSLDIDEIEKHDAFNSKMWDEYAKKDAAFLLLESEIPNLMDDVDSEKLAKASFTKGKTKPIYKEKQLKSQIPWCIAAVPNEEWAKDIFPDSDNAMEDFWDALEEVCLLKTDDPIKSWDETLKQQAENIKKLNTLQISKLYYKNNLGTSLELELPKNAVWQSASSGKWIVNLPSYEVFTTPDYRTTNGIVYSSKPLIYMGKVIDEFYLKFENGKVIDFDAKKGKDILKEIINIDKLSAFLGEVAIVNYDSPISNTNLLFKSTIFDENASCHLALGSGFIECLKDSEDLSKEELDQIGLNQSKNHVDFMIGTKDLLIEADTNKGRITIMQDGNLII